MQRVDRKQLPPGHEPKVGMGVMIGAPDGKGVGQAIITEVAANYIMLDLNHPLAGRALTFEITITNIS